MNFDETWKYLPCE